MIESDARRTREAAWQSLESGFDASEMAAVLTNLPAGSFGGQSPWHQYLRDVELADDALRVGEAAARSVLEIAQRDADRDYRNAVAAARRQLAIDRATQARDQAMSDASTNMLAGQAQFLEAHPALGTIEAEEYQPTFMDATPVNFDLYATSVGGLGPSPQFGEPFGSAPEPSTIDDHLWPVADSSPQRWNASWWWGYGWTPGAPPDDSAVTWHTDGYTPTTLANWNGAYWGSWDEYGDRLDVNALGLTGGAWGNGNWGVGAAWFLSFGGGWTGWHDYGGAWWWGGAWIYDYFQPTSVLGGTLDQKTFELTSGGYGTQYWQVYYAPYTTTFPIDAQGSSGATLPIELTVILQYWIPNLPMPPAASYADSSNDPPPSGVEYPARLTLPDNASDFTQSFTNLDGRRVPAVPQSSTTPFVPREFDVDLRVPKVGVDQDSMPELDDLGIVGGCGDDVIQVGTEDEEVEAARKRLLEEVLKGAPGHGNDVPKVLLDGVWLDKIEPDYETLWRTQEGKVLRIFRWNGQWYSCRIVPDIEVEDENGKTITVHDYREMKPIDAPEFFLRPAFADPQNQRNLRDALRLAESPLLPLLDDIYSGVPFNQAAKDYAKRLAVAGALAAVVGVISGRFAAPAGELGEELGGAASKSAKDASKAIRESAEQIEEAAAKRLATEAQKLLRERLKFMRRAKLSGDPSSEKNIFLFDHRNWTVQQFVGKYRAGSVNQIMPAEAVAISIEEALRRGRIGDINVRKLILDLRDKFVKQ